jgi:hypothetical protein
MPAISVWSLVAPGLKSLVHFVFGDNAVTTTCKPFAGSKKYSGCQPKIAQFGGPGPLLRHASAE